MLQEVMVDSTRARVGAVIEWIIAAAGFLAVVGFGSPGLQLRTVDAVDTGRAAGRGRPPRVGQLHVENELAGGSRRDRSRAEGRPHHALVRRRRHTVPAGAGIGGTGDRSTDRGDLSALKDREST